MIGPNDKRHPIISAGGMCEAFDMLLSQDFEINIYLPIGSNETNEYDNWFIN